jgi:hypothetical protein
VPNSPTANDIAKLPPEFSRAERFDGVFFLDLPSAEQRRAIWRIYLDQYQLDDGQALPADDFWTGAEIKACCRLAALLDVPLTAAAQNIVPVARTSAESVEKLCQWAAGRCLSADRQIPATYITVDSMARKSCVGKWMRISEALTEGDNSRLFDGGAGIRLSFSFVTANSACWRPHPTHC